MAIVKMKKLRLLAVREKKEELLKELMRHGCVEISELEPQLAADAESAGKLAVESALQKADAELQELSRQVNEKAKAQAASISGELEKQKAALRAKAGKKLEQAAAMVVERIVNS